MAAPLSLDLRLRVVRAVDAGMSRRAAAARFGVAIRTAVRWVGAYRASGSLAPQKMGKPSPPKLTAHRVTVLALLHERPDGTIEGLRHELAETGIVVGYGSIRRFFAREGITRKKRQRPRPSSTGPTSKPGARPGSTSAPRSTRAASSSSTRPGPRPT
jgi:transposase